jgi:hypothetical protein
MTGGRGKASGGSLGLGSVVVAILDGNWNLNGTLTQAHNGHDGERVDH